MAKKDVITKENFIIGMMVVSGAGLLSFFNAETSLWAIFFISIIIFLSDKFLKA